MAWLLQCAFIQILCVRLSLRGPASDQPDDEGTFRGSDCVAGEAAGGAGLPGEQAGGGPGSHGGTDPPKPGAEQENRGGGETRGSHGRLAGEGVLKQILAYLLDFLFFFSETVAKLGQYSVLVTCDVIPRPFRPIRVLS